MNKTLCSLAVMTTLCGMAHAQSNVTLYGLLDTGLVKETGSDLNMSQWNSSRIGFKGTEDLGNGYQATFQLEKRYFVNNGTINGTEWEGASNVGLSGPFGSVRLGRVNELETESFRRLAPFNEEGIASMLLSTLHFNRISNTIRYDSPVYRNFSVNASYTLGTNTDRDSRDSYGNLLKTNGADNDGFAVSLNYDNGPILLLANFSRLSDSDNSFIWSLGGQYRFGPFKTSLGYEQTRDNGWKPHATGSSYANKYEGVRSRQDNYILSGEYATGPHKVAAAFNYMKIRDIRRESGSSDDSLFLGNYDSGDARKYSIGYFYSLSKRTTLYGQLAYTDFEDKTLARFFRGETFSGDSVTGISLGINHLF